MTSFKYLLNTKQFLCTNFVVILLGIQVLSAQIKPVPAAYNLPAYITLLQQKRVGLVLNQTSMVGTVHLLDTLRALGVQVTSIFAPEHGFRGQADAGEYIKTDVDQKTGIPLFSLYGKNKKPLPEQLAGVDVVLFDIQDVGVRFYTYISTLHYVMEACAEQNKHLIVLDRPNPNGSYIDGPVLDTTYKSFVGMHPVPIVYGMTIGEYATMIKGEKWIVSAEKLQLTVIKNTNYTHQTRYSLPVRPSPNLPNDLSIALYPSLCLFEGTPISVARGTIFPFQAFGYPDSTFGKFVFTPVSILGMSKDPMYNGRKCYGVDLRNVPIQYQFTLAYVQQMYGRYTGQVPFFNAFFIKLLGDMPTLEAIKSGKPESEIRKMWISKLDKFKQTRSKYLLYP